MGSVTAPRSPPFGLSLSKPVVARRQAHCERSWGGASGLNPFGLSLSKSAFRLAALLLMAASACASAQTDTAALAPYTLVADSIPQPLTDQPGDATRGRGIVVSRQSGLCLLCHTGPFPEERFQGTLAPDLGGAGDRWSAAQLRLRLVDGRRSDPLTFMPSYYRVDGLTRVGNAWRDKPVLTGQQIEDVVAFLVTLRAAP
ncbi:hypothetical protein BH11PSE8_BH11PSE8_47820 [soil metagenome]